MALDRAHVDDAVWELRPDFAVLAVAARVLVNGPGGARSEAWRQEAKAFARSRADDHPPAHVSAWHDACRAFGARPQRTAPSVDALWTRARGAGLPRVNRLVDAFNAVSVRHVLPVGGEDLARFEGPIRLARAAGTERFETVNDGQPADGPATP